jgi:hypothetical protein
MSCIPELDMGRHISLRNIQTLIIYESVNGIGDRETTSSRGDILSVTSGAEYSLRVLKLAPVGPICGLLCEAARPYQC